jgi:hypothetical protein
MNEFRGRFFVNAVFFPLKTKGDVACEFNSTVRSQIIRCVISGLLPL